MSNALYSAGRSAFARGDIAWLSGTTDLRAVLVNVPAYAFSSGHASLADIPSIARRATVTLVPIDPAGGAARCNTFSFNGVTGLTAGQAFVIYEHNAVEASAPLLAYFDTGTGLPVVTNASSVSVTFTSDRVLSLGGNI